jgi:hypothetical protein
MSTNPPDDIAGIVPKVFCKRRKPFGPTFGTLLLRNEINTVPQGFRGESILAT